MVLTSLSALGGLNGGRLFGVLPPFFDASGGPKIDANMVPKK